jgi:hypothetical protein
MIFEPVKPFLACEFQVKFATEAWERRQAAALRRRVFCDEQGIFAGDDRDEIDDTAIPLVAISLLGVAADEVIGTVRIHEETSAKATATSSLRAGGEAIHPQARCSSVNCFGPDGPRNDEGRVWEKGHEAEAGVWWGSRLAVAAPYRRIGALGTALIKLAVSSAHARGCTRFLAHVQAQNAPLFHRLHWRTLEEIELLGHPHHKMEADLAFYPPFASPELGFHALLGKAA